MIWSTSGTLAGRGGGGLKPVGELLNLLGEAKIDSA